MSATLANSEAAAPRYVARTGVLSITTWDWHSGLAQVAHRLGTLAWVLFLAGASWKKLPQEMIVAAGIVSGIVAVVAGLMATLLVLDPTGRWKEGVGATVFAALMLVAAVVFVVKSKVDVWPYVRQWLRLSFEPALVMWVARGLLFAFVVWVAGAFAYVWISRDE
jgi:hypothetical protein